MRKRIVMIIMAAALIALPTMAQDWQSTSAMQGTGSNYSSQVTAVGATDINSMATTTDSYSPAKAPGGPRKDKIGGAETGQSTESPIGDAVLPLLFMAIAFGGYIAIKRRNAAKV
jgi:hypothetical protein